MNADGKTAAESHDSIDGIVSPAETMALSGHAAPRAELEAALSSGRMHHGWLFQGPRGIGKATAAFAFARRLVGGPEAAGGEAGRALARQIAGGGHPNVLHIARPPTDKGEGFKTQITVDEIRKLARFFHRTTSGHQWRIAIIDPADDMNRSAANALLKILEEPPERSIFLVTNHLPGRLLPTIRSRCRVLRFDPLTPTDLAAAVANLGVVAGEKDVAAAATLARGSVRTALSLLANGGLEIEGRLERLFAAREPDWIDIQALADSVTQKGRESAFDMMLAATFRAIAEAAMAAALGGRLGEAAALAHLFADEDRRVREGLAFNLDRKQMILTLFDRLHRARSAGPVG